MAILRTRTRLEKRFRLEASTWIWAVAFALSLSGQNLATQPVSQEYQIKAAFLYNFSRFVEWPKEAFQNAQSPLVIGIIGDDPFGSYLDDIVRGEKVASHPLVVRRFRRVDEIKTCHILFVSQSETNQMEQILANIKGRNILTVGDVEGFAQRGGVIRFVTESNKTRIRINVKAARTANLTISSKLLRVSEIITP